MVTRVALTEWAWLRTVLAADGITLNAVVVADDENREVANENGFDWLDRPNSPLGRKVNDGFAYAFEQGADWLAFVGSDDWVHPDLFGPLMDDWHLLPPLFSGHHIAVVDLEAGKLRRLGARGPSGVAPWFIPRWMLEQSDARPIRDDLDAGLDGSLARGLPSTQWVFHDPHDLARVDFKTRMNMTPYGRITKLLGFGSEVDQPWELLATQYSGQLVEVARETHERLAAEAVAA